MSNKIPLAIHTKAVLIEAPGVAMVIKVDDNQIALTHELAKDIANRILALALQPKESIPESKSPYIM